MNLTGRAFLVQSHGKGILSPSWIYSTDQLGQRRSDMRREQRPLESKTE